MKYKNKRMVFRKGGKFATAPSLEELGYPVADGKMTCADCGHEFLPILKTGYCPQCNSQRKKEDESREESAVVNLFQIFNEARSQRLLTGINKPTTDDVSGDIYHVDGKTFAIYSKDKHDAQVVIGLVPDEFVEQANNLKSGCVDSESHARACIKLAINALSVASMHQISGSTMPIEGGWENDCTE